MVISSGTMDLETVPQNRVRKLSPGGPVAILLATYNGEKYLEEQLRSLLAQTHGKFNIIARDDGSNDSTLKILTNWSATRPEKISVISDSLGNLRSLGNFSRLMEACDAPYFAFCDQDDVWLPDKIELTLNKIQEIERKVGSKTPILVHSDLTIVDENLKVIAISFFNRKKIRLKADRRLDHLIINNVVTGCASIGNRALLELMSPIPDGIVVHDWWAALIAASCGVLETVVQPTILYRQHGRNQIGARQVSGRNIFWEARHILRQPTLLRSRLERAIPILQSQANVLLRIAGDKMSRRNQEFLRTFCLPLRRKEVVSLPWAQRTWLFVRYLMVWVRLFPLALRWCY